MTHMYITVRAGIPVTLEDGRKCKQKMTERAWVHKVGTDKFLWRDASGRVCSTVSKILFPPDGAKGYTSLLSVSNLDSPLP